VAANFLTLTYVDNLIGSKVRTALFTDGSTYKTAAFVGTAEAATGVIRNAITSAGYTAPTTTTDQYIMLGTLGEFCWMAYNRPDKRLPLPKEWASSTMAKVRADILSGEAELDLPQSTTGGFGGILGTPETTYPTIFSRTDLDDVY